MPEASSASWSTLAALVLFIAASVWLGALAQRVVERGSFMKGYFLGNRGLGAWALALTATVQSGGTFMGFPSLVYANGWIVALWIAGYMVVPLTGFGVLGKRLAHISRRTGALTVPDMLRYRFDSHAAGLIASLLIMFFMSAMMIAQFKAGAIVMKIAYPESGALSLSETSGAVDKYYHIGLAVFAVTVVGYTLIGGFLAAVWTDLFQSVMMFVGVMILLPLALMQTGGLEAASRNLQFEPAFKAIPDEPPEDATNIQRAKLATLHEGRKELADEEAFLRTLDAALRRRLAVGDELPAKWDDAWGEKPAHIEFYGGGRKLEAAASEDASRSTRRTLVALSTGQTDEPRAALFSNGMVRSGLYSKPGDLSSGPGPSDFQPLGLAVSFFCLWIFAGLGSPAGMVRIMACKDTTTIRRSIFLLSSYNLFIYLPLIAICICARTLIPDLGTDRADEIIPRLALLTTGDLPLGGFIAGLILAAPFGAVMATVSSYLVVIASGLIHDVYQRFIDPRASERVIRWLTYGCMVLVGAIAVWFAQRPPPFLQSIVIFSGTCGASTFVVPALMTAYCRRATAAGTIASMLAGVVSVLALYVAGMWLNDGEFKAYKLAGLDPVIWGIAASLLAGIVATYASAPPPASLVSSLFDEQKKQQGPALPPG